MERAENKAKSAQKKRQKGYIMLAVLLVMTIMLIALSIEVPRIAQEIQREKEEELVHRGREYAMAIKRFYHKMGFYPASLDQLEGTNNLRFLRKRYKDPMTESGEFKLVHVGEAQINLTNSVGGLGTPGQANGTAGNANATGPGTSGLGSTGSTTGGSAGSSGFGSSGFGSGSGALNSGGLNSGGLNSGGSNSGGLNSGGLSSGSTGLSSGSSGLNSGGLGSGGLGSGSQGTSATGATGTSGTNQPTTGQMGSLTTQNIGNGTGGQGGGQIIGVVSTSKRKAIKTFNQSDEYDEWLFVYDPRVEQAGGGGVIVAAPVGSGSTGSSGIPQPVQPVRTSSTPAPTPQ